MKNRYPLLLPISIGVHLVLLLILFNLPVATRLAQKVIPIRVIVRHHPKPKKAPRPKTRPLRHFPHAWKTKAMKPVSARTVANAPRSFGVSQGSGGTMAVAQGQTLEAPSTASAPAPLVLDMTDESDKMPLERQPSPIGALRVSYPELARLADATGSAEVEAWVDETGRVLRVKVLSIRGMAVFARAAAEGVKETPFHPALRAGIPVACSVKVPVHFSLDDDSSQQ